jgi:membrane protease YdiL (CAAX protease family)
MENIEELQIEKVQAIEHENVIVQSNPDNPTWGVLAGIGVWFGSVLALFIFPTIAVAILYFIKPPQGLPTGANPDILAETLKKWLMTPPLILAQIAMTMVAHLATIALCWAVATKFGKTSFKDAIGWRWNANSMQKFIIVVGVVGGTILLMQILPKLIPDTEDTPFNQMLKTSQVVRYVVAALAVLTAPVTEELVYRGMLYSSLKRAVGVIGAVGITTLLFAAVHVPQYWGAWASLTGLLVLSLALTIVRAVSKSLQPCVIIHTLFNFLGALGIILSGGKTP